MYQKENVTINKEERIKAIKAMEFLARQINHEGVFIDCWLQFGVADGDIEYGDLSVKDTDEIDLDYYIEDENFIDLIDEFIHCMRLASRNGGLYIDNVCGGDLSAK